MLEFDNKILNIWDWSDYCTKSHVQECLHHWTGLPGDDRTLVPGAEDQGGVVRDIQVQDGVCCWYTYTYSIMNHIKCFNLINNFFNLRLIWLICVLKWCPWEIHFPDIFIFQYDTCLEKTLSKHIILHTIIRSCQTKTKMPSKLFTKQLGTKNEKSKIGQNNLRPDIHLFKI